MTIARLARAVTGREHILKFEGCYHGHADGFLVRAGSGVATLGLPDSPGVPEALATLTLTARYNDLDAVEKIAREVPLAAIMLEPIVGNGGLHRAAGRTSFPGCAASLTKRAPCSSLTKS